MSHGAWPRWWPGFFLGHWVHQSHLCSHITWNRRRNQNCESWFMTFDKVFIWYSHGIHKCPSCFSAIEIWKTIALRVLWEPTWQVFLVPTWCSNCKGVLVMVLVDSIAGSKFGLSFPPFRKKSSEEGTLSFFVLSQSPGHWQCTR